MHEQDESEERFKKFKESCEGMSSEELKERLKRGLAQLDSQLDQTRAAQEELEILNGADTVRRKIDHITATLGDAPAAVIIALLAYHSGTGIVTDRTVIDHINRVRRRNSHLRASGFPTGAGAMLKLYNHRPYRERKH